MPKLGEQKSRISMNGLILARLGSGIRIGKFGLNLEARVRWSERWRSWDGVSSACEDIICSPCCDAAALGE